MLWGINIHPTARPIAQASPVVPLDTDKGGGIQSETKHPEFRCLPVSWIWQGHWYNPRAGLSFQVAMQPN